MRALTTGAIRASSLLSVLLCVVINEPVHAQDHAMPAGEGHGEPTHGSMQMPMPQATESKATDTSRTSASPPAGYSKVVISPQVQQRIGVTTAQVVRAPLVMTVRTVGILQPNETKVDQIHLRTEGWVQKLFVSFTGQQVHAGEPLLSIYSPQFFTAQQDYLISVQSERGAATTQASPVVQASRRRLELWDVPREEIEEMVRTGQPKPVLVLRSHVDGTVLEKKVFPGQYVVPQDTLFVLADLSTVWVQTKIYEYELPHTQIGQTVTVTLSAFPLREFSGKVVFISPVVEETSRTIQVRIELPNPDGLFKPGMFANVVLTHNMGEGLLVPSSAVIQTGERDIAFRVEPQDRFVPVEVKIAPLPFGDRFQALEGLHVGERVVTSANFLIDSESRLEVSGGNMAGMAGMEMGGQPGEQEKAGQPGEQMPGMEMPAPASQPTDHSQMQH